LFGVPYAWSWRWRTKMRTWHMEWSGEFSSNLKRFEGFATTTTSMKIGMICIYSCIYRWSILVNVGQLKVRRQNLAIGKNRSYDDFHRNFYGISIYSLNAKVLLQRNFKIGRDFVEFRKIGTWTEFWNFGFIPRMVEAQLAIYWWRV